MAISVGIPMMFLDRQNHYGAKPNSKHGNAKAIIDEALPNEEGERKCRDMDFNPARTQNNRYLTSEELTSEKLLDRWNDMCDSYKVTVKTKNGIKERSLRADADIGFAMIVKPSGNEWGDITIGDQHRFLADSVEAIEQVCKKYKVKIDVAYEHRDEKNMHAHIFGHDDSFKLSKKLGLAFMNDLNHGLYVDLMKAKDWKIEPKMSNYVEDTQGMNEEELAEYKEHRKAGRKEHGKSSKQYKSDKDIEKKMQEVEKLIKENEEKKEKLAQERVEIDKDNAYLDKYALKLTTDREELDKEKEKFDEKVAEAVAEEKKQLTTDREALAKEKEQLQRELEEARKMKKLYELKFKEQEQKEQARENMQERSEKNSGIASRWAKIQENAGR